MRLSIFCLALFSASIFANSTTSFNQEDLTAAQNIIKNMMEQQQLDEIQKIAQDIQQQGVDAIEKGVSQQFSQVTLDAFGIQKDAMNAENPFMVSEQLVMFVSSSMPIETLRNYARDLSKVRGVMVVRGAQGGIKDYLKTRQWIWMILKKDRHCNKPTCATWPTEILFDPVLFSMYNISHVPALIYQPDMGIGSYCDDSTKAKKSSSVAYGDAYLGELIDSLIRQGEDNGQLKSLRKML